MDPRVRPLILSFLIVVVILFLGEGRTIGASGHAVGGAFNETHTSRTTAVLEGPTATACPGGGPFDILIVYTDDGPTLLLRSELLAQTNVATVALFNAYVDTPTLLELQPYDLVVAMGNLDYQDPETLGDNLADYHDGGGVVVPVFGSFFDSENYAIRGRWESDGYSPYTYGNSVIATSVTLGSYDPTHPLMQGVNTLDAIARVVVTPAPAATSVAVYSDGSAAVAYKSTGAQTSVGISAYLGDAFNRGTGDYARVIANAAEWLVAGECPTSTPTATELPSSLQVTTLERRDRYTMDSPYFFVGLLGVFAGFALLRYRRRHLG